MIVCTKEDKFAVKVLNLISHIESLVQGCPVSREIPIFGILFDHEVFLFGIIDEIQCDPQSMVYTLVELKTRKSLCLPGGAQKEVHALQAMLYKKLLDNLILGHLKKSQIEFHLNLDLSKKLSQSVFDIASEKLNGLDGLYSDCNLNILLDVLFDKAQNLTCISQLLIEYCHQKDEKTFAYEEVHHSDAWLEGKVDHLMQFWTGKRDVCGVDIEDVWKCQLCDFKDVCEWRRKKAEEYSHRKK